MGLDATALPDHFLEKLSRPNEAHDMAARLHHPKPKRVAWQATFNFDGTQSTRPAGIIVWISRLSPFTLDEDNYHGGTKFLVDQLRYAELIPADSPEAVEFRFRQCRVQRKNEKGMIVEIEYVGTEPVKP
jgi:hypothetical protein